MSGHPEEGQENRLVDGALHVGHRRRQGQGAKVKATRSQLQVRVETLQQRLVKHHLVEIPQRLLWTHLNRNKWNMDHLMFTDDWQTVTPVTGFHNCWLYDDKLSQKLLQ